MFKEGKDYDRKVETREKATARTMGKAGLEVNRLAEGIAAQEQIPLKEAMKVVSKKHPELWKSYTLGAGEDQAKTYGF